MAKKRRNTGGFELSVEARQAIDDYADQTGIPKVRLVSRVMNWFAAQPPAMKRVVIGDVDEGLGVAYAEVLERIAQRLRARSRIKSGSPKPPEESLRDPSGEPVPPEAVGRRRE